MTFLKPFVLLLGFGAAVFFVLALLGQIGPWWNRRIDRYVAWLVARAADTNEPLEKTRARRIVTYSALVPPAVMLVLRAWPLAVIFCAMGLAGPYAWMRYRMYLFRQALDNQLVDALILMANAMKSGLSLLQALELAAAESRKPIVDEFGKALKEVQLGRSIDNALLGMSERLVMPDLEMAVHSIVTLRETGGNLTETFMTVANTIVERKKIEGKIATLTAQGLYQGFGLCAMPFIFGVMFYLLDPEYMKPMLTTGLGWAMWLGVLSLDALGMWVIFKIVSIDV